MSAQERPFRFGVALVNGVGGAEELERVGRRVEALGYSTLFVGDHLVEYDPPSIVALAWLAGRTETLRFGTLVLGNDYRHPAVLAKDSATFDVVSGGRLEFGLGAGWLRGDYDAIGLQFDEPRVRVDRLAEALTVIKSCWSGEPFQFSGDHYSISDYRAAPLPVQQPRPPLLIGGGSPRVLRLAGAEADIVGIHSNTAKSDFFTDTRPERTRRKVEWVREGAGSRFAELELMTMCMGSITTDREAVASPIAEAAGVTVDATLDSAAILIGTVDEVCETLRQRRQAWGTSYIVLDVDSFEEFAPVVERLAGT